MTQDGTGAEQEKEYGDSAAAVSPDTQYADPDAAPGETPGQPADRQDDTYGAGEAATDPGAPTESARAAQQHADEAGEPAEGDDDQGGQVSETAAGAHGTSAETVSDGPDKESGFYG